MRKLFQGLLAVGIVAVGAGGFAVMLSHRPEVVSRPAPPRPPLVEVVPVERRDVRVTVESQGTVRPRTTSPLVPEVSGRVVRVSPSLVPGGFFDRGDALVEIDPRDFELAVVEHEASVAESELRLARVTADAELARREWERLGEGEPTPLVLKQPQLAEARAALAAARARLERSRRELERTTLRAPYDGRTLEESVDVGQHVTRGQPVGRIYAIDVAEVRVPLPDEELAFLEIPLSFGEREGARNRPRAIVSAEFGGRRHHWAGRVVRTEGELDPRTRMIHAVVEIEDPHGGDEKDRPPLAVGLYVDAAIEGILLEDVAAIPRAAFRDAHTVLVVGEDRRASFREVEVLRREEDRVLVGEGLVEGELVSVTPLEAVTEGMKVRIAPPEDGEGPERVERLGS